jgi:hypothetical protein
MERIYGGATAGCERLWPSDLREYIEQMSSHVQRCAHTRFQQLARDAYVRMAEADGVRTHRIEFLDGSRNPPKPSTSA